MGTQISKHVPLVSEIKCQKFALEKNKLTHLVNMRKHVQKARNTMNKYRAKKIVL